MIAPKYCSVAVLMYDPARRGGSRGRGKGKETEMGSGMKSRPVLQRLIIALTPVVFLIGGGAVAEDAQEAVTFIDEFGNRAISELTGPDLTDADLQSRFRKLFEEGFDVSYIARSALGRFWRKADEQQRADYSEVFEDYMVQVYSAKFRQYSGQTFKATAGHPAPGGGTSVSSLVSNPDGPETKIDWTVEQVEGKQKIRDIKIEGVSMITSYRDEFAQVVLQNNGQVQGLIDTLRTKTEQLRADKGDNHG